MEMTEFEIIKDYGESKDKAEQIKILADLNMCKPEEIAAVLKKNGIPLPKGMRFPKQGKQKYQTSQTKRKTRMNWSPKDVDKLVKLISEGLTVVEIAERLGVSASSVSNQIQKKKLRKLEQCQKDSQKRVLDSADSAYIKELEKLLKEEREEKARIAHQLSEVLIDVSAKQKDALVGLRNIRGLSQLTVCAVKQLREAEESNGKLSDAVIVAMANILDTVEFLEDEHVKNAPDAGTHQGPQGSHELRLQETQS